MLGNLWVLYNPHVQRGYPDTLPPVSVCKKAGKRKGDGMNGMDPDAMTPEDRLHEIGVILARAVIRRRNRLQSSKSNGLQSYSLDFREASRLPAHGKNKEKRPCKMTC